MTAQYSKIVLLAVSATVLLGAAALFAADIPIFAENVVIEEGAENLRLPCMSVDAVGNVFVVAHREDTNTIAMFSSSSGGDVFTLFGDFPFGIIPGTPQIVPRVAIYRDSLGIAEVVVAWADNVYDGVEAAYQMLYKPAIQNGQPVAVWVTYPVYFKLNEQ